VSFTLPAPPHWAHSAIPDNVRNGYPLSMNPPTEAVKRILPAPEGTRAYIALPAILANLYLALRARQRVAGRD